MMAERKEYLKEFLFGYSELNFRFSQNRGKEKGHF